MGEKIYELKKIKKNGRGMPLIGDKFPKMEVQTTHGMMSLPGEFKGKWFILFSHPADFTPVCTTEFIAFQNRYEKFKELNCELIGLSVDQVFSHLKWIEWIKENMEVDIMQFGHETLGVELPNTVELEVTETEPGIKGDTTSGGTKPATLETGLTVQVPFFVNQGDRLIINTTDASYVSRA